MIFNHILILREPVSKYNLLTGLVADHVAIEKCREIESGENRVNNAGFKSQTTACKSGAKPLGFAISINTKLLFKRFSTIFFVSSVPDLVLYTMFTY